MPVTQMANKFNPLHIPGCALWLEADRGITLDGSNNVSAWADQSGNGRHAVQATAGNRPIYAANIFGALPALECDATPRLMTLSAGLDLIKNLAGFTYITVFKMTATALLQSSFHVLNTTGTVSRFILYPYVPTGTHLVDSQGKRTDADATFQAFFSTSPNTNANISRCFIDCTNNLASTFVNGSAGGTAAIAGTGNLANENSSMITVGGKSGTINPIIGYTALHLLYSRVLTSTECQRIERFYGKKYGITVA